MLTRDGPEKKKGFFLRHWVRQEPDNGESFPQFESEHLHVAIVKDLMIVRVNIDRPMSLEDTFKSVPFATWMFQVVQIDAVIEEAPGVRFAFAIERTVTPDERVVIQGNAEHTKEQTKIQKAGAKANNLRVAPVRIPPQQLNQMNVGNTSKSTKSTPRSAYASVDPTGQQQPTGRPLTVANPGGIVSKPLNPRNAVPVPNTELASGVQNLANTAPVRSRSNLQPSNHLNANLMQNQPQQGKLFHPLLRFWENRPLDDPYEPIFVTNPDESTQKASKTWLMENSDGASIHFDYRRIQCLPGSDFPEYAKNSLSASTRASNESDLVVVHPMKKAKKEMDHLDPESKKDLDNSSQSVNPNNGKADEERLRQETDHGRTKQEKDQEKSPSLIVPPDLYISVVKAAAEFNDNLAADRMELSSWLVDDKRVAEESAEASKDEDDSSVSD